MSNSNKKSCTQNNDIFSMLSSVVNISENESPANKSRAVSTHNNSNNKNKKKYKLNKQPFLLNNVCLCFWLRARSTRFNSIRFDSIPFWFVQMLQKSFGWTISFSLFIHHNIGCSACKYIYAYNLILFLFGRLFLV